MPGILTSAAAQLLCYCKSAKKSRARVFFVKNKAEAMKSEQIQC